MSNVDKLVEKIVADLKICKLSYFDVLETSVGQTDGTELAKQLGLGQEVLVGGLGSILALACREVCADTLEATEELRRRLEAGDYIDLEDVYEVTDN